MKEALRLLGFVCLAATWATAAPTLWVNDDFGWLGTVDVATGIATVHGHSGMALTDIAFDPSGTLYGVNFWNLYRLNPTTAEATLIGLLGPVSGVNSLVFGSDGTLYGAGNHLYKIDTVTGAATDVGAIGFDSAGDLAFLNGVLYLTTTEGRLVRVDTTTGAGAEVGPLGVRDVYGLAAPGDGMLYAVADTNIYTVDPLTGAATLATAYGGQDLGKANGAAFFSEARSPVPEPATVVLLGAGLGVLAVRRRCLGRLS